jgi:predicted permease
MYLAALLAHLLLTAWFNNLVVGPAFYRSLAVLFVMSVSIYAYGVLAAAITDSSGSALALFLGLALFFIAILMGSVSTVSVYVRSLSDGIRSRHQMDITAVLLESGPPVW